MDSASGGDATGSDSSSDSGAGGEGGKDAGTAFCNANPTAKFCEDFDLGILRPGWSAQGGAVQIGADMPHSAPNHGKANTPFAPPGTNPIVSTISRTVDATGATTWRLQASVRLDSYMNTDGGTPLSAPRALQLVFGQNDYINLVLRPWTGMVQCLGLAKGGVFNFNGMMVAVATKFWHSISIEVKKAAMYTATCTIDQTTLGPFTVDFTPPPNDVSIFLGVWLTTSGSPVGAMQVSYDNVLFFAQ